MQKDGLGAWNGFSAFVCYCLKDVSSKMALFIVSTIRRERKTKSCDSWVQCESVVALLSFSLQKSRKKLLCFSKGAYA